MAQQKLIQNTFLWKGFFVTAVTSVDCEHLLDGYFGIAKPFVTVVNYNNNYGNVKDNPILYRKYYATVEEAVKGHGEVIRGNVWLDGTKVETIE